MFYVLRMIVKQFLHERPGSFSEDVLRKSPDPEAAGDRIHGTPSQVGNRREVCSGISRDEGAQGMVQGTVSAVNRQDCNSLSAELLGDIQHLIKGLGLAKKSVLTENLFQPVYSGRIPDGFSRPWIGNNADHPHHRLH